MGAPDFEAWYATERPALVRAIWAIAGDRDLAADVVDEAFSRALERWTRVSSMDSPGGWVRVVALNQLRRTLRRRSLEARLLRRRHERDVALPEPDDDGGVWSAVAALPLRQRQVIALRYALDCSEAETAAALGISEGAASASLAKARRRLGEVLRVEQEVVLP